MNSDFDEAVAFIGPMPSGHWHRDHVRKLDEEAKQTDAFDTEAMLGRMIDRANAEVARWAALPCNGEVEHVKACSEAFQRDCPERLHAMCARAQKRRLEEDRAIARDVQRRALIAAGVSERTVRAVFDGEPLQTEAVVTLRSAFERTPRPSIIVLQGGVGCGKSCAAALWAVENRARWVTAKALARMGYEDELAKLGSAKALVLDDLGTEYADAKGFFVSNLDGLIDDRYSRELPTVITTNVAPEEFKARYGERIADRIREAGKFIGVKGASLRRRA